jgi:hypothetical protein
LDRDYGIGVDHGAKMNTDLWIPALAALLGAAVGGVSNYFVMTAQANRESVERAKMRAAERADRYATTVASVIGEVTALLHHLTQRESQRTSEPTLRGQPLLRWLSVSIC